MRGTQFLRVLDLPRRLRTRGGYYRPSVAGG